MQAATFSIIINSFNRLTLLQDAIGSLNDLFFDERIAPFIVVVDAGSDDGSIDFLESYFTLYPSRGCVVQKLGISFSGGCNLGASIAITKRPEVSYLLFFETDNLLLGTEPIISAIKLLSARSEIAAAGFVAHDRIGKRLVYGNEYPTVLGFVLGQVLSTKLGIEQYYRPVWIKDDGFEYAYIPVTFTSPLLIKSAVWQQIRGMDEETFPFGDSDVDMCYRIGKLGYQIALIMTEAVIHDNLNHVSSWSSKRVLDYHRARFSFFLKHNSNVVFLIRMLLPIRHMIEIILGVFLKDKLYRELRIKLLRMSMNGYKMNLK